MYYSVTYARKMVKTPISRSIFKEKVLALTQKVSIEITFKNLLYLTANKMLKLHISNTFKESQI